MAHRTNLLSLTVALSAMLLACGGEESNGGPSGNHGRPAAGSAGSHPGDGGRPSQHGGEEARAAVPVEVTAVQRRDLAAVIETNGTLEAESEVDLLARSSAPVVELVAEEGDRVRKGQVLLRLDDQEIRAQLQILRLDAEEAQRDLERAEGLAKAHLVSSEELDNERARLDSLKAQQMALEIQLGYSVVEAPFSGLIVARYVQLAQQVSVNTPLYRISDFEPMLCPVQVPEGELERLAIGQRAWVSVEAFDERFAATVDRIRPVVDAASGTVRVTLEVETKGKLRPGMFARVSLETDTHPNVLVIPRGALVIDAISDVVYVVGSEQQAERREVSLGIKQSDSIEILEGLDEGEQVVVVGQDGLSSGTPIRVIGAAGNQQPEGAAEPAAESPGMIGAQDGPGHGGRPDFANMDPEEIKKRMRDRGMSEEQIEERLKAMRERSSGGN